MKALKIGLVLGCTASMLAAPGSAQAHNITRPTQLQIDECDRIEEEDERNREWHLIWDEEVTDWVCVVEAPRRGAAIFSDRTGKIIVGAAYLATIATIATLQNDNQQAPMSR
ncbi:hypothetical protein [Sphingomicrobium sediminis]|uniref:Uncharacterized protein n=1 Tax=Sphingomicrobium sediminis TaxID=2950949 RepID=A0A9X2J3X5_9SPHN|nr:hypothetical protein [Sphingomicrobium sediminis]MCM8556647.1 hypothetical protein [Sphingomicrobium sediminis]